MRTKLAVALPLAIVSLVLTSILFQMPVLADQKPPEPEICARCQSGESQIVTATLESTATATETVDLPTEQVTPTPSTDPEPDGSAAGETKASQPDATQWAGLCGVPMEVMDWEESQARRGGVRLSVSYSYPSSVDWRTEGGRDWTTSIRNQSGCSSCVAFATAAAIESRLKIVTNEPDLNPDLSEAQLFYCGCGSCCGTGWAPSVAMEFARDAGLVDEGCYPYTAGDQSCQVCGDWETRVTKVSEWIGVTNVDDMKQALADDGPFEATMLVYTDFFHYSGGVYEHTWGELQGAHAVTVVGYDDNDGYWIVKNSWGRGWGENGWFRIAYGQCGIDNYGYVPRVEKPSPTYHLETNATPAGSGAIIADPSTCTLEGCEAGTVVQLTAFPEARYEFGGWEGDVTSQSASIQIVIDGNKTVTAQFTFRCDACAPRAFVPFVRW